MSSDATGRRYGTRSDNEKTRIDYGRVYLLTHGCPTRNDFTNLLDQLPWTMSNGLSWSPTVYGWKRSGPNARPFGAPFSLAEFDPRDGHRITDRRDDVVAFVCDNPYYGRPDLLQEELNEAPTSNSEWAELPGDLEGAVSLFADAELALIRTSPHQPLEETYYEADRLLLGTLPRGGATVDIRVVPKGEYH
jgi:hypothetical protein